MNLKIILLTILLLVSILSSGCVTTYGLEGRKTISECMQINESGSYIVTQDLGVSGDCLGINVHYVTVDLNGFTIYGDGTGAGVTTYDAHRRGVVLRNGSITNFNVGVEMKSVRDATIEDIRSTNNAQQGIRVGLSGTGEPSNALIKNCIAVNNGSTDIVSVGIVTGSVVEDMTTDESVIIGNTITNRLDANHGIVVNNSGKSLLVGNCPALIMGNNFKTMTSLDPPFVFNADCKVADNIPAGLTSP